MMSKQPKKKLKRSPSGSSDRYPNDLCESGTSYEEFGGGAQNPFSIYLVAKNITQHLEYKDLVSLRMVCKAWKGSCDEVFYERAQVTRMIRRHFIELDVEMIPRFVRNLRICSELQVRALFSQITQPWISLNELVVEDISFANWSYILNACYVLLPNLIKLKLECVALKQTRILSGFKGIPGVFIKDTFSEREIGSGGIKLLKLKAFSFKYFEGSDYFHTLLSVERSTLATIKNFVNLCPQLMELKFDIDKCVVFKRFVDDLLELQKVPSPWLWLENLKFLHISIPSSLGENYSGIYELIESIFISCPLKTLLFELHLGSQSLFLTNLPTSVEFLTVVPRNCHYNDWRGNWKTILRHLADWLSRFVHLNGLKIDLVDATIEFSRMPTDRNKKPWFTAMSKSTNFEILKFVEKKYCKIHNELQITRLLQNVSCLTLHLQRFTKVLSVVKRTSGSLTGLQELEIHGDYKFSDEDIVGDRKQGSGGICEFTGLCRLHFGCDIRQLTAKSISEGFLKMSSLTILSVDFGNRQNDIFDRDNIQTAFEEKGIQFVSMNKK